VVWEERSREPPIPLGPKGNEKHSNKKIVVTKVYQRYNLYTMLFEFDPEKSDRNKEKHGIDFYEAQALWEDPDLTEIPAKTTDGLRFMVIGSITGTYWSGVITYRGEEIRIISVRRSRKEEIETYEG
jgi:uncharacterized protein